MATAEADVARQLPAPIRGLNRLPGAKQAGLIIGLAGAAAIAAVVTMWLWQPNYTLLYAGVADSERMEMAQALQSAGIDYQLDSRTGDLLVPNTAVHDARMALAALGLPQGGAQGYALLDQDTGFGTSKLMESTRFRRALEGELAQSIGSIDAVHSARVHLAVPEPTVFVRQREEPSASVMLNVFRGRTLNDAQIAGIIHLVASSVADLTAERVSVVDQTGRLLTQTGQSDYASLSENHFDQNRRLEETLRSRVLDIITPLVGRDGVRAQVLAEMDFSQREETSEQYEPPEGRVRSEQVSEQRRGADGNLGGVPGALTNQPPQPGVLDEPNQQPLNANAEEEPEVVTVDSTSVRNYELNRTVSHLRQMPGQVERLSIAVVLDYRETSNDAGEVERLPRSPEELAQIERMVRSAVGYNEARGDTVEVTTVSFAAVDAVEDVEAPSQPIWEQPWLWDAVGKVGGLAALLALFFLVFRPVHRSLTAQGLAGRDDDRSERGGQDQGDGDSEPRALPRGEVADSPEQVEDIALKLRDESQERQLDAARELVREDPKRVARVMKSWIAENG
jgi:flagellar M-ring protein FliF